VDSSGRKRKIRNKKGKEKIVIHYDRKEKEIQKRENKV